MFLEHDLTLLCFGSGFLINTDLLEQTSLMSREYPEKWLWQHLSEETVSFVRGGNGTSSLRVAENVKTAGLGVLYGTWG
jgi:hypothetical protein